LSGAAPDGLGWRTLTSLSWDEAADAFNRCYEGYVIPVRQSGRDLAARCMMEDGDSSASYVVGDRSGPVAIGLIARRGNRARLAAFAVVPRVRGQGVSRLVLSRLADESHRRGDATLELEVFEHNLPAVRLYSAFGFERVDRLLGFELDSPSAENGAPAMLTLPVARVVGCLAAGADDLPWQLRPETISWIGDPWQVGGDGEGALALVDLSRNDMVSLRLLFTPPSVRRMGRARGLLAAIRLRAAGRPIRVPQLIPESHAAFAEALGFVAAEHAQLRMVRLNAPGSASAHPRG
jgi:GNAT superfamily N-acetyltransferase